MVKTSQRFLHKHNIKAVCLPAWFQNNVKNVKKKWVPTECADKTNSTVQPVVKFILCSLVLQILSFPAQALVDTNQYLNAI